jgi:quercetin dioxygenase-like cupin family protein
MQIVHLDEIEWFKYSGHREPGIDFKRLLQGEDMSPNNFEFILGRVQSRYTTPRHRHNFDQVRFVLDGSFGFDKNKVQKAGSVGYFPEGCFYEQDANGASDTLVLQAAGGSAAPYMSYEQLRKVARELAQQGEFKNGIYSVQRDGKSINQDGFEAVWEHAFGRELKYPRPRYDQPIVMHPENFEYVPVEGEPGVAAKRLGRFGERELEIGFLRLEPGATHRFSGARDGAHVYYVLSGDGRIGGKVWSKGSAIHLLDADAADFEAGSDSEIYYLRLPTAVS